MDIQEPQDTQRDIEYKANLKRIYELMTSQNVITQGKSKLPLPKLNGVGPKKVMWENFKEICTKLHRQPEHTSSYFFTELGTQGSFDGNNRLIICGKFRPKHIESVLKKYIDEYVTCTTCRKTDTILQRDQALRIDFMVCSTCGTKRSVAPIESGFHAITKVDRKAQR